MLAAIVLLSGALLLVRSLVGQVLACSDAALAAGDLGGVLADGSARARRLTARA